MVIRLSAMGDVAMTIPVIKAALEQHPEASITVLTRQAFVPLFHGLNVQFVIPDLKHKHKGLGGLFTLFRDLQSQSNWDVVIDLHNVLRSKIIRTLFKIKGIPTHHINKGRKEKRQLTAKSHKVYHQLTHTTTRYADVFKKAGLTLDLSRINLAKGTFEVSKEAEQVLGEGTIKRIGIAPFAQHEQKMYPLKQMQAVVETLDDKGYKLFIFGGGQEEKKQGEILCQNTDHATNLIGKYPLTDELGLLSGMDVVLTMDSANMHMAALVGTPVLSVWGATHPFTGFGPFGQHQQDRFIQVSIDELPCRPCSVFGNKPCHRGDFACMNRISPDEIVNKIESVLNLTTT